MLDLVLFASHELGISGDRDLASLFGVSTETIANWRTGAVKELKGQTLAAVKRGLQTRFAMLRERAAAEEAAYALGLCPIEIEDGSDPAAIQRQFRDRVHYDYLGHRFLYFDPQGALAWEMLIKQGYDQDRWLRGVEKCLSDWMSTKKDRHGKPQGPLAQLAGVGRPGKRSGMDVVSLGPGEGGKEQRVLDALLDTSTADARFPWLSVCLVDVSIPLLLEAARGCRRVLDGSAQESVLLPVCGDFEEGALRFIERLPTARHEGEGARLVLMLGNTFGNLRNEEAFVRRKLWTMTRPGDFVWLEVGLRPLRISEDPLSRFTDGERAATSAESSRRRLLLGPYRRWEAAAGRSPKAKLEMRVWTREEDESCQIPGSINFCHDLLIAEEERACTMLYSRRYKPRGVEALA